MEVVHLLLSLAPPTSVEWGDVLRTIVRVDFLKRARTIDLDAVLEQPRLIDYVCRRLKAFKLVLVFDCDASVSLPFFV
jgi:hypothetical protein